MQQGWISIQRSIRDHWLYQDKRVFSRYEAWLDLLMDANHKDNKVLIDGKLVEVKVGQQITSIRKLSERWGWSNTKIKNFLELLEKDGMITKISDTKKTVITIDKYRDYQSIDSQKTTQKRQSSDAETTQKHTNNNVNNDNNENKKDKRTSSKPPKRIYDHDSIHYQFAEKLFKQICQNKDIKQPDLNNWADDIRKMMEIDKRTEGQVDNMIDWATSHNFWGTVILSATKLRAKYDTMAAQANGDYKANYGRGKKKETLPDWAQNEYQPPKINTEAKMEELFGDVDDDDTDDLPF